VLQVTPRRLQVLVAVVDHGGFGAAAAALDIAQPSVSAHIRALEGQVGAALFDRFPGQTPKLTEAGRTLYTYACDVLDRAQSVVSELGHTSGRLRFAAQRSVATALLRRPLELFAAECPAVELIARTGTFEEVLSVFRSGAVDLVFVLSHGEVPGLDCTPLGRYRLAFVAPRDHPLAKQVQISPRELAQHPFVAAPSSSYFGRTLTQILAEAGVPPLTIRSRAEEAGMLREMMLAGLGICLALRRSVQNDLESGILIELDVDLDPMYLRLNYARNPRAALPQIDRLVELVRQSEAQVVA